MTDQNDIINLQKCFELAQKILSPVDSLNQIKDLQKLSEKTFEHVIGLAERQVEMVPLHFLLVFTANWNSLRYTDQGSKSKMLRTLALLETKLDNRNEAVQLNAKTVPNLIFLAYKYGVRCPFLDEALIARLQANEQLGALSLDNIYQLNEIIKRHPNTEVNKDNLINLVWKENRPSPWHVLSLHALPQSEARDEQLLKMTSQLSGFSLKHDKVEAFVSQYNSANSLPALLPEFEDKLASLLKERLFSEGRNPRVKDLMRLKLSILTGNRPSHKLN